MELKRYMSEFMKQKDLVLDSREKIIEKVKSHIAAVDEKSIKYYLDNAVCGTKPELPCFPRYFSPRVERR